MKNELPEGWRYTRTRLGEFAAVDDHLDEHFARVIIANNRVSSTDAPIEVILATIRKYQSLDAEDQGCIENTEEEE